VEFTFYDDESESSSGSHGTGSTFRTVLFDDEAQTTSSTIMSKLDVSTQSGRIQLTASPEAKLNALIEITQSLGRAISLDAVLPTVLKSLFKIFVQADRGFIVLRNDEGALIPRWTQTRREDRQDTIRISRTIVNEVMRSKEAILSADAAADSRFEMSQSIADFRIRSMMCAPLLDNNGDAMGVLQIDTVDQRNRFEQEDLEVLASVALQAGIAIENAQLHDAVVRQREVERDLQLAKVVQKAFLPEGRPEIDGYEFFDYYQAANHVGGDYYDYISLPNGRTAVIVADVVGHGVAAAMFMAKLSAETRFCLVSEGTPAAAVTILNHRLSGLQIDRFVTLILVVLDPKTHEATIVNAGHMPPLHRRTDGSVEEPGDDVAGLPVAIADGLEYEQLTIKIEPGETLAMYTDGINEAMDSANNCFGIERIREHVRSGAGSLQELGENIINDVRLWVPRKDQQDDDMCLVCLHRKKE
jgi:serine phosphatase RsbU (regulator of sigma subunit)